VGYAVAATAVGTLLTRIVPLLRDVFGLATTSTAASQQHLDCSRAT
jgi:hypothetical protein